MSRYRPKLLIGLALAVFVALLVAGFASAEKPVAVKAGNLELTFNGGFTPKALSKTKPTPIALNVSGKIATLDGTHPPAPQSVGRSQASTGRRSCAAVGGDGPGSWRSTSSPAVEVAAALRA